MFTNKETIEKALELMGYDINQMLVITSVEKDHRHNFVLFVEKLINKIFDEKGWDFVLKETTTNEIISINDIVAESGCFPTKGDTIVIKERKFWVGYCKYFSDEQIVEFQAQEL